MSKHRQWLLLLALSAGATACGLETGEDPVLVENTCSRASDCSGAVDETGEPTGRVRCEAETGMCVGTPSEPLRIGVEMTPATDAFGATPPTVTFEPLAMDGPTEHEWALPAPITVVGKVHRVNDGVDERVPAEITFTRPSAFPGGDPTRFSTSTSPDPLETADGPADYSLRIVSRESYDLIVEPTGDGAKELPPLRFEDVPVPGGGDVVRLDVTYGPWEGGLRVPAPESLETVSGQVVSFREEGEEMPVDGLRVRAVEAESGRAISSTAITGEDNPGTGEFTVRLAPGSGPYVLRITPGEDRPLFPTVIADPSFFFPGVESPRILVPRPVSFCYEGFVETRSGEGVADATVTFRSEDIFDDRTQIKGSFRATTTSTGTDGSFQADLLPGSYEVVVTAPSDSGRGVATVPELRLSTPTIDGCVGGMIFEVPERTHLGGRVLAPDGTPVVDATVQARSVRQPPGTGPAQYARSNDTLTDATGRLNLPLDVGVYDVTIKPGRARGYSWLLLPGLEIGTGAMGKTLGKTLELQAPMPLRGTAVDASGEPLVGAQIEAHVVIEDEAGGQRTVQIGRAETGDTGSYELLVPSRLVSAP